MGISPSISPGGLDIQEGMGLYLISIIRKEILMNVLPFSGLALTSVIGDYQLRRRAMIS